jgi:hypothetical protein
MGAAVALWQLEAIIIYWVNMKDYDQVVLGRRAVIIPDVTEDKGQEGSRIANRGSVAV